MSTYVLLLSPISYYQCEFPPQQHQHIAASDGTPRLFNIYSAASDGSLLCVLMNKTQCLSFLFNVKSPWTVTGTKRIFTCVETPGSWIICWRLCSFQKLPPRDMFHGECSYLLSSPLCIALLIVCSYVPPLLRTALQERERERERKEKEGERDYSCDHCMWLRLIDSRTQMEELTLSTVS